MIKYIFTLFAYFSKKQPKANSVFVYGLIGDTRYIIAKCAICRINIS